MLINDGIALELCSLQYTTVNDAIAVIQNVGRDVQLVKPDIKGVYQRHSMAEAYVY